MLQIDRLLERKLTDTEYQYNSMPTLDTLKPYKMQRKRDAAPNPNYGDINQAYFENLVRERTTLLDQMSAHVHKCPCKDLVVVTYLSQSSVKQSSIFEGVVCMDVQVRAR